MGEINGGIILKPVMQGKKKQRMALHGRKRLSRRRNHSKNNDCKNRKGERLPPFPFSLLRTSSRYVTSSSELVVHTNEEELGFVDRFSFTTAHQATQTIMTVRAIAKCTGLGPVQVVVIDIGKPEITRRTLGETMGIGHGEGLGFLIATVTEGIREWVTIVDLGLRIGDMDVTHTHRHDHADLPQFDVKIVDTFDGVGLLIRTRQSGHAEVVGRAD